VQGEGGRQSPRGATRLGAAPRAGAEILSLQRRLCRGNVRWGRRAGTGGGPSVRGLVEVAVAGGRAGAIDLDGALEVRAVLNHDARRGQVSDHRAILLDFDAVASPQIALHAAIDDAFTSHNVRGQLCAGAYGELAVFELDQPFDAAVHMQIFISRYFALYVQAGAEPGS